MKAIYCQRGEILDHIPAGDIEAGQVVDLKTRIGVAAEDIPAGRPGHIHVAGVFAMPKAEGEEIAQGAAVCYDAEADAITATPEAAVTKEGEKDSPAVKNTPAGYAAVRAAAADAAVLVKLLG